MSSGNHGPTGSRIRAELAERTGIRIDVAGAALGYDHWLERIVTGDAPPSLVGAEMPIADGLCGVPLVDPTPVYPWWAMWRTGTDPGPVLAHAPLGSLEERAARPG